METTLVALCHTHGFFGRPAGKQARRSNLLPRGQLLSYKYSLVRASHAGCYATLATGTDKKACCHQPEISVLFMASRSEAAPMMGNLTSSV